jgi:poly(glycerol-phosphate) alpha-glucosyltransferase
MTAAAELFAVVDVERWSRKVSLDRALLPADPIYVLLSVVPESFGGLTTAALQRSTGFSETDVRPIEVLTKSDEMIDPAVRTDQLRTSGQIGEKVRIRNVWFEIMALADEDLAALSTISPLVIPSDDEPIERAMSLSPLGVDEYDDRRAQSERDQEEASAHRRLFRKAEDGTVLQVDHMRPGDGTLAISDRRDLRTRGARGGRLITLFTRGGQPAAQWRSLKEMYHSWMDLVIGSRESILIIDSAPTGGLFFDYQRDNVTTVQCIHTHHLRQMRRDVRSKNTEDVMRLLTHLDWFDVVAVLTSGQLNGLQAAGVVGGNGVVLPNMLIDPPKGGVEGHDQLRGVIVGRQASVKRLDHAIRAIALAAESEPGLHVDMFGHGQQSQKLLELSRELGVSEIIAQHGYDPRGKDNFATASFTLLCSKYEGFGLVLLEAMAAGCIPIAYDVEYGPEDLITDGVNGFLVPDGDTEALALAITRLLGMEAHAVRQMREAAIKRASDFSPERVTIQWGHVLDQATSLHARLHESPIEAELIDIDSDATAMRLIIDVTGSAVSNASQAMVGWIGRSREAYGRVEARMSLSGAVLRLEADLDARSFDEIEPGAALDVVVDLQSGGTRSRSRIGCRRFNLPDPVKRMAESTSRGRSTPDGPGSTIPYVTVKGNLSFRRI